MSSAPSGVRRIGDIRVCIPPLSSLAPGTSPRPPSPASGALSPGVCDRWPIAFRKISSSVSRRCVSFLTSRFCRAVSPQMASTSTPAGSTIRQRPAPSDTPSAPISGSAIRRFRSSPVTSSSTKDRFDRRSSSRLQWCAITPSFRITASSHTCSMSRSRWEQMSTFMPCSSFMSATSFSIRRRAAGSSPLVGSSSTTSSGPWTIAWASLAICFIP